MKRKRDNIWIGLVEVKPRPGTDFLGSDEKGAYVTTLALAQDAKDFETVVAQALDALGLDMIGTDETELYSERIARFEVDQLVRDSAQSLSEANCVSFCTFHTFPFEAHGQQAGTSG